MNPTRGFLFDIVFFCDIVNSENKTCNVYPREVKGGIMDILYLWKWAIVPILLVIVGMARLLFKNSKIQQREVFVGRIVLTVVVLFILVFLWFVTWWWRGLMYT